MSRWRRLRRWIAGQAVRARPADEDPEILLQRAQDEMRTRHATNREHAVRAITQKNNLKAMVEETEKRVARLEEKLQRASQAGDESLMLQIIGEKQIYEQTLEVARVSLEQATLTSEQVKVALKRDEELIRRKTAETLALKTQWRLIQVEESLTISLAQLSAGGNAAATRNQLRERHRRNRELVIEAITQKNTLESIVAIAREQSEMTRAKADSARRDGDEDLERKLLREMEQHEASLASTNAALRQAIQLSERARTLLEEESAHFKKLHLTDGTVDANIEDEDDSPTESDIARYRSSIRRAFALAVLFALVALILSLIAG